MHSTSSAESPKRLSAFIQSITLSVTPTRISFALLPLFSTQQLVASVVDREICTASFRYFSSAMSRALLMHILRSSFVVGVFPFERTLSFEKSYMTISVNVPPVSIPMPMLIFYTPLIRLRHRYIYVSRCRRMDILYKYFNVLPTKTYL